MASQNHYRTKAKGDEEPRYDGPGSEEAKAILAKLRRVESYKNARSSW